MARRNFRSGLMGAVALALGALHSSPARAQDLKTLPGLQERLEHERDVVRQLLDAGECPRACLALEAMHDAADRICRLDAANPGKSARKDLEATAEVVRKQCPTCDEIAQIHDPASKHDSTQCDVATSPPPKAKGGGCAACAVGASSSEPADESVVLFALGAVLLMIRRRPSR